ncbi:MAG: hypothetical protein F4X56_03045 [Gammaproteobacteria bacterium]|nr:hypothetical protein [Gammaproteobacteria bacterium]MYC24879.1 hypothetical protein [Gammaproteobacteria bacterium]
MKNKAKIFNDWCVRATCITTVFILWGCSSGAHVVPSVSIPDPLIDPFPKTVGIYYPPELKEKVHEEERARQKYVVELGSNQKQVFDSSLGGLFEELVSLESATPEDAEVDGIFVPEIVGVILATPADTGQDYYEVQIRYRIELFDPNGDEIYYWVINAYGKVHRRDYGSVMERTSDALQQATENALRDASTQIIERFNPQSRPDVVSNWLSTSRNK